MALNPGSQNILITVSEKINDVILTLKKIDLTMVDVSESVK